MTPDGIAISIKASQAVNGDLEKINFMALNDVSETHPSLQHQLVRLEWLVGQKMETTRGI